jgi:hypothetical protein
MNGGAVKGKGAITVQKFGGRMLESVGSKGKTRGHGVKPFEADNIL